MTILDGPRGTLKNTETHVASPGNGAEIFLSTFNEDPRPHVKMNVLGDGVLWYYCKLILLVFPDAMHMWYQ